MLSEIQDDIAGTVWDIAQWLSGANSLIIIVAIVVIGSVVWTFPPKHRR